MPFPAIAAETIISTLSEALFLISLDGEIQHVNQAALTLLEYEKDELIGLSFDTIIVEAEKIPRDLKVNCEELERTGVIKNVEIWLQTKYGTTILVSMSASLIRDKNGKPQGIVYIGKDLAGRKHVEKHLLQLEKAVETMQIGVTITDLDGKIIYTNPADAVMHGYRVEELLGKDVGIFTLPELRRPRNLQQIKKWKGMVRESLNIRKDGSVFPVWLMSEIVKSPEAEPWAVVTSCEDITKRKWAEEALREAEAKFRSIFENAIEGIFQSSSDGRLLSANPALARIHGYDSPEEFLASITDIGQQLYVNPDDRNVFRRMLKEKGQIIDFETQLCRKDGSVIWVSISARSVFDNQGNLLFYEGTLIDITARKRAEKDLRKHQEDLEELVKERTSELTTANTQLQQEISDRKQAEEELKKAKEVADAANKAKSEFLTNMSHELRTPLNAILGYTQILKRDKGLTEKQKNAIDTIHHSSEHLLMMINELLDLSRIESRKMEPEPTDVYLPGFLKGIVEIARIRAQQKGISFDCVLAPDLPIGVHADEKRLRQILLNLLNNAIKFTEKGSVTFKIANCELRNKPTPHPSQEGKSEIRNPKSEITRIRFQIDDQGVGIPPDQLENIFQPFQQVGDRRFHSQGTGLGLAISQQFVRMMGAELHVTSTPGQGSTFWFDLVLPVIDGHHFESGVHLEQRHIIGFKGDTRKILIVDDKDKNRAALKDMLLPLGFEIAEAVDGQDALAKATPFHPDLILMDMMMPVMDGIEATRRIRKFEIRNSKSEIPLVIIGISASAFDTTRQVSLRAGCDDFLAKPVQIDELLECLRVHLALEWIYEEPSEIDAGAQQASEMLPLVALPEEELMNLLKFAKSNHITGIKQSLAKIKKLDRKFIPFVTTIEQLVENFQFKHIIEIIQSNLQGGER